MNRRLVALTIAGLTVAIVGLTVALIVLASDGGTGSTDSGIHATTISARCIPA
jgi:hypothetical protein